MLRKIHVIDYGIGNLFSVTSAIKTIGFDPIIISNPNEIASAEFLVLPGVGAFQKGMYQLRCLGWQESILRHVEIGRPILGICLGMQMFFESSEEHGFSEGLGLIAGHVKKMISPNLEIKVPHIGWSLLTAANGLLRDSIDGKFMYFVHSYYPITHEKYCTAKVQYYDQNMTVMVNKENIIGCQFHPEKSGHYGLLLLKKIFSIYTACSIKKARN